VKCTPEVDTFGVHLYRQSQDRGGTFAILEKKGIWLFIFGRTLAFNGCWWYNIT
jgi:hypothetical protein